MQLNAAASASFGHNKPPSTLELSGAAINALSDFMKDHPVIQTEDEAREAKPLLDRAKLALEEIEAERDAKVRPLNTKVAEINAEYKALHNTDPKKPGTFDRVFIELKARVSAFMLKEEQRRIREAQEAAAKAAEAERIAREAEQREQDAKNNAAAGELDIDIADATKEADASFADFERASRFADRAERDTKVKIGGGFGRTAALRTVETLHLDSYNLAIKAIGPHPKIEEAILSAAREYRKIHDRLPDGVSATQERKL